MPVGFRCLAVGLAQRVRDRVDEADSCRVRGAGGELDEPRGCAVGAVRGVDEAQPSCESSKCLLGGVAGVVHMRCEREEVVEQPVFEELRGESRGE